MGWCRSKERLRNLYRMYADWVTSSRKRFPNMLSFDIGRDIIFRQALAQDGTKRPGRGMSIFCTGIINIRIRYER